MHHVRFRDPAGNARRGQWRPGDDDIVAHPEYGSRISLGDETFDPNVVEVLPPCEPSKLVCVGLNYASHAAETDTEIPDRPLLFLKAPNAVAAHGSTVPLLPDKDRIEFEAELAVVIAERCRNVSATDASDVIAGYTCMNDLSNRDDQRVEQNWVRGKAFDGAAPLGPVIATPEEVPEDARIQLRLNGETRQDATVDDLIFPISELIAEVTTYMTLEPGDVLATGTPEGVGPLHDDDHVEIEIEGVGALQHRVRVP